MNIRNHPFFGVPPCGTAAFLKERDRIVGILFQDVAPWLILGVSLGFQALY